MRHRPTRRRDGRFCGRDFSTVLQVVYRCVNGKGRQRCYCESEVFQNQVVPILRQGGLLYNFTIGGHNTYTELNLNPKDFYISPFLLQQPYLELGCTEYRNICLLFSMSLSLLQYTTVSVSGLTTSMFGSLRFITVVGGPRSSLLTLGKDVSGGLLWLNDCGSKT